jgi:hypothetical protein
MRGEGIVFVMDMPNVSIQEVSANISQAYLKRASAVREIFEETFSSCSEVGNSSFYSDSAFNSFVLLPQVLSYLGYKRSPGNSDYNLPEQIRDSIRSGILHSPRHGTIFLRHPLYHGYAYRAEPGYVGPDKVVFWVEVAGKRFKITYELSVVIAVDEKSSPRCVPVDLRSFEGDTLEIVLNNWRLRGEPVAPGVLAETTSTGEDVNITLSPTANGYGWFIDLTPSDNAEFLPTSNPFEWIATASWRQNFHRALGKSQDLTPSARSQTLPTFSAQATITGNNDLYDTVGACHLSPSAKQITISNDRNGYYALSVRLLASSIFLDEPYSAPQFNINFEEAEVTVFEQPEHGYISQNLAPGTNISYYPDAGYYGADRVSFLVTIEGKKIKLVYFIKVDSIYDVTTNPDPNMYKNHCPHPNPWRIPPGSDASATERRPLTTDSKLDPANVGFSFKPLSGANLAQVTGNGRGTQVSLHEAAAGYGWFIDITPSEELLEVRSFPVPWEKFKPPVGECVREN